MHACQVTSHRFFFLLDKHWCTLDWHTFSEKGLKCDEDQLTLIYSEHPVLDLPSCSLIANYQFVGKSTKQHAMLVSGNNPALMRSFHQGLKIQVCRFSYMLQLINFSLKRASKSKLHENEQLLNFESIRKNFLSTSSC